MYECFHCGTRSVVWDSDFDFSDYGWEGEGIIHVCHCANCGAEIEYRIPFPIEEEKEENEGYVIGEYIVCSNPTEDKYKIGRIKSLEDDGAFICLTTDETAVKIPYDQIHRIGNSHLMGEDSIGGRIWAGW